MRYPLRHPFCFFASLVVCAAYAAPLPARAQKEAAPPVAAPVPADVVKTLTDISDLSLLRALLPVKWKPAQIDKVLLPLQTVRSEGDTRRKADEAALRAVSGEVAKAHEAAVKNGTPTPAETEAKIIKTFDDSNKRFLAAKKSAIDRILPVLQVSLTGDQKTTIKNYVEDKMLDGKKFSPKAKPDAIENAALELYIERILLDDRSMALLTLLRSSSSSPAASATPSADAPPATKP